MRLGCILVLTATLLAAAEPAHADQAECSQAYEQAQRSRKAGKLIESRAQLVTCSQDGCPGFIRKDCAGWLTEVEHEVPSIAVRVLDKDGCDRPDAPVWLDGREAKGAAGGASIELDPGTHALRAQLAGETMEQTIVLARTERGRIVTLAAGAATTCNVHKPSPPASAPPIGPERPADKPVPPVALVLGGVGVLGLGVGAAFSVSGWSQRGDLDDCRGTCSSSDVDAARRSFLVGDIGLGVGLVALAAAAVIYFTR
jgi:hypothetical protein